MLDHFLFPRHMNIRLLAWLLGVGLCLAGFSGPAQAQAAKITITNPAEGDALQGVVSINGVSAVDGFRSAEVDFAYQSDPTGTWFMIQQATTPVSDGLLAKWDTTTISDGNYRLRVQVILSDGKVLAEEVSGLRVRNYTQVETRAPKADTGAAKPAREPTPTALADFQPQVSGPTAFPTNPAQITPQHLKASAAQGVFWVVGALLVTGIYLGLRALLRRS